MNKRIIILSGAGLSAESGIQTFRSTNGLWHNHDVRTVADIDTWRDNFDLVHQFYNERRRDINAAEPNGAHKQIAAWQAEFEVINLTQNIDDLLERAGCTNVIHLHGVHNEMQCKQCGNTWAANRDYDSDLDICRCGCKRLIKPNVVFFGETAPKYVDLQKILFSLDSDDIIIVVGTSNKVLNFNDMLYGRHGLKFFVNVERSGTYDVYDYEIIKSATDGLAEIDKIIKGTL